MKTLILILMLAFSTFAIPVTGRVVDIYNRPVPFIRVIAATGASCNNWQAVTTTNSFGYFRMEVIANCEMVIAPVSTRYGFYPDGAVYWPAVPARGSHPSFVACRITCEGIFPISQEYVETPIFR